MSNDLGRFPDYEAVLKRALHDEVAGVEPRPLLPQILAAARRGSPWLMALILGIDLAVVSAGAAWLATRPGPPPAPPAGPRQQAGEPHPKAHPIDDKEDTGGRYRS